VKQLIDGSQPEGYYEVVWNGKDNAGRSVASGIYYYQINACGKTLNKKMLLVK
jgi:flagellar hook assembly protein FlgD